MRLGLTMPDSGDLSDVTFVFVIEQQLGGDTSVTHRRFRAL